jgi:hypothetical protein
MTGVPTVVVVRVTAAVAAFLISVAPAAARENPLSVLASTMAA